MPPKASLNVSLTPELTAYIATLVASGQYRSASEVVRESLRLLQREGSASAPPASQKLPETVSSRLAAGSRRQRDHG